MRPDRATGDLRDRAGYGLTVIMLGTVSDRPRTVNDVSAGFFHILDCRFSWQVQYLVMLEGDSCCSAQCI